MAIPKPEPRDWLKAAADELKQGDRATLTLLQESYREVNEILKGLPDAPDAAFGNLVYRAQLERTRRELLAAQSKLFDKLGDKVSARRLRSASRAAKLSAAANAALLRLVGEGKEGQRLYDGADITAQRTIETILARAKLSAVPLSERIYKTSAWMHKRLDTLIATTMARGLNAQKFARVARDWFSPSVPGGTRYAAMRLARTEINNAFHATSIDYAIQKPWVDQMEWHLSKSHPVPDKCNPLAAESPYAVREVPLKPHPQCMCYVTERQPDEDEWIDRFVAGEFDDYLDGELAKANANLGIKPKPVSATPQPQQKVTLKTSVAPQQIVPDVLRGNAAHEAVPKGLFKRGSLTPKQRKALHTYETGWFSVINGVLRGILGRDEVQKSDLDTIDEIDSAMAESVLTSDIEVYRGLYHSKLLFGDRLDNDLTGFAWDEKAYGSTTTEPGITDAFSVPKGQELSANVKLTVRVPAGVKALEISTSTKGSKDNGPQAEIQLQRDLEWKVTKDHGYDSNGIRHLDAEVSPIGAEALAARAAGGADGRGLRSSDPGRADQPASTSPNDVQLTFKERLSFAAKGEDALAAATIGDGRPDNPAAFDVEMLRALKRYTGSWYADINNRLRGEPAAKDGKERAETYIQNLDKAFAMSPLKRESRVYRGLHSANKIFGDRIEHDLTGMEWREDAYISTTSLEARTKPFVNSNQNFPMLMRILVPEGAQAIEGSGTLLEAELLLARGARLRVAKDNGIVDGIRRIDVEVLL